MSGLFTEYARPLSEHTEDELLRLVRTSPARGLAAYDELRDRGWSGANISAYLNDPLTKIAEEWIR